MAEDQEKPQETQATPVPQKKVEPKKGMGGYIPNTKKETKKS